MTSTRMCSLKYHPSHSSHPAKWWDSQVPWEKTHPNWHLPIPFHNHLRILFWSVFIFKVDPHAGYRICGRGEVYGQPSKNLAIWIIINIHSVRIERAYHTHHSR